jgi:hypothetical protein
VLDREEAVERRALRKVQAIEALGELGEGVVSNYMYMSAAEVLPSLLPKSSMESVLHTIH